jgi:hypothetical protein
MRGRSFKPWRWVAAGCLCSAAASAERQSELWNLVTAQGTARSILRYELEVRTRTQLAPDLTFVELKVMPSAGVSVHRDVSLWLGYARVQSSQPSNRSENRLQQRLLFDKVIEPLRVVLRAAFEQRWFSGSDHPAIRFRALVRAGVQLPFEHLYLQAQEETFFTLFGSPGIVEPGFEQARAQVALHLRLPEWVTFGLGYMAQYTSGGTLSHNLITQLTFHIPTSQPGDRALAED